MDKYLRSRRDNKITFRWKSREEGESLWSSIFGKKEKQPEPPSEDLTPEEQARLAKMEDEINAIDEAEAASTDPEDIEVLEEARESLIERFFQSMRLFRHKHKVDEEAEYVYEAEEAAKQERLEMDQDVKEALRIAHTWLNQLSKRKKDDFKASADFKRYAAILEKYGVAKKK